MIGADYAGVLQRDGWQSYRQFTPAPHQTCLAHLLRRCRMLLLDYPAQPFVLAVKALLQAALATRDALSCRHRVGARARQSRAASYRAARAPARAHAEPRLASSGFRQHLIIEFDAIFSFLFDPTLDATNWRAEQALRPAVVTRKMCGGGNRTARGADSQQVLASVLRTADQRGLDATDLLVTLLTAPTPTVPELRTAGAVH